MKSPKKDPTAAFRAGLMRLAFVAATQAGTDASEFLPQYGTATPSRRHRLDDLLRTKEAAVVLNVSLKTLQNWRVTGVGPKFVKVGASVSYRYADLLAFVRQNTSASTSERSAP
ncbi:MULTISPECIES: helix-turn-helix domain-containing protein [unclassified Mesorhizobium]|uniref:helix-turn-helix domain-containing protein n=1 Tax=unclassified Mesorhizobium TaxID=325217 RepID=UPI001AED39D0|nr:MULTISPECIES: helix-turn-helix domain-containing protein [unclassified Mesorhizobium]MBZ9679612.1 helix-turn-helix domain-containing protein [Mesorhizobium sp. CO1-1-2]